MLLGVRWGGKTPSVHHAQETGNHTFFIVMSEERKGGLNGTEEKKGKPLLTWESPAKTWGWGAAKIIQLGKDPSDLQNKNRQEKKRLASGTTRERRNKTIKRRSKGLFKGEAQETQQPKD